MAANSDPDGGYKHWHDLGGKKPPGNSRQWSHAKNSGTDWSTGPGIDPKTGMPRAQTNVPGGSVGGEAKKLGVD